MPNGKGSNGPLAHSSREGVSFHPPKGKFSFFLQFFSNLVVCIDRCCIGKDLNCRVVAGKVTYCNGVGGLFGGVRGEEVEE
jgi:hypothetical protein